MPGAAAPSGAQHPQTVAMTSTDNPDAQDPDIRGGLHMAVHWARGRVGLAYWEPENEEILCLEGQDEGDTSDEVPGPEGEHKSAAADVAAATGFRLVQLARLAALPAAVHVSSKTPPALAAALAAPLPGAAPGGAHVAELFVHRAKLFSPDAARAALERVRLPTMAPGAGPRDRLHVINTTLSLCAEQQVCAAGALIAILAAEGILQPGEGGCLELAALRETSLTGHLLIDPASMEALGIFKEEVHPSAMGLGAAKEGLSVFGLLDRCVGAPGRRLLRLWFSRPLVDVDAIEERLDGVETFLKAPEGAAAVRSALRGVKDPGRLLARLRGQQTLPDAADFVALQRSLEALLELRGAAARLAAEAATAAADPSAPPPPARAADLFSRLATAIPKSLIAARRLIADTIDPDQAAEGFCVRYGVSDALDEAKALYYGLPDLLRRVQEAEVGHLPLGLRPAAATTWAVTYVPQLGFLLQVEGPPLGADVLEARPDIEPALPHGVWEDGRAGACYHTANTRELERRYGDVLSVIRDREAALCGRVARDLAAVAPDLRSATAAAAELDCLAGLAAAAAELRLTRPVLTPDNILEIHGGRHLLAEAVLAASGPSNIPGAPTEFIPNDTAMGAASGRLHVITGPNLSGKSCYAKQVAVIAVLAHVGCFVPATSATVGIVDRVFTRVVTREIGAVPQSAFMIDLTQVAAMLRLATPRSLLVIDEFGKGTLAADGVGLVCGALGALATRNPCPPRVLLATHFTEVLDPRYLSHSPYMAFYTMAVALAEEGEEKQDGGGTDKERKKIRKQEEDLVFLYRMVPGQAGPSFGPHCAALAGVDPSVVARAREAISAAAAGRCVPRAVMPQVEERTSVFKALAARLLGLDCGDAEACRALLTVAAEAAF